MSDATAETAAPDAPLSPGGGQASNRQKLRAIVIGPRIEKNLTTDEPKSRELSPDDVLAKLTADGRLIEPPFDKLLLSMLPEHSTELPQCVDAMEVNIEGFGSRFDCRVKLDAPDCPPELKLAVAEERARLTNWFQYCGAASSAEDDFVVLRRKKRRDQETCGEAYWEVIRDPLKPFDDPESIVGFNHIPSYQLHIGRQDQEPTTYQQPIVLLQADGSVALAKRKITRRFRRFVQTRLGLFARSPSVTAGYKVRWFKEFGDPRTIDNETGDVVGDPGAFGGNLPAGGAYSGNLAAANPGTIPLEKQASELIHWKLYNPRTPYGLPRTIGNLITIFGDRAADEINFNTLKNNNIPSMAVFVSNGHLTDATVKRIEEFVQQQINGTANYSRFLIVEAEGNLEGPDAAHIKIDIKPLTNEQMRDMMFKEFGQANADKIRRSFRLHKIFVGQADDITKASAEAARRLTDEQVFKPERDGFDNWMNKNLLPRLGIIYHKLVTNGPNVTDDEDLIRILMAAERTGGLTPRIANRIISDIFGQDIPMPDEKLVNPDVPFSLQLAQAVKNTANVGGGGPPLDVGNQVTALKALVSDPTFQSFMAIVEKATDGGLKTADLPSVKSLLALRDQLELALTEPDSAAA